MSEHPLLRGLIAIQDEIQRRLRRVIGTRPAVELARVVREEEDDSIFEIDRIAEDDLLALIEGHLRGCGRVRVTAEGLTEKLVIDGGGPGRHHLILDPVDGSRLLAWDKRSAFSLAAVAVDRDGQETLEDIELAVQTELPTSRSQLADRLIARRGHGVRGLTLDLRDGSSRAFQPRSSRAADPTGGFGSLVRFFAPGRDLLARIDDELAAALHGTSGRPLIFEDQYLSTGGIMHQLATGRDRFSADLRPRLARLLESRGATAPLCSHPYDLCTYLVAREAGAIVTSDTGGKLDQPLDRLARVGFIAYANESIRARVEEPLLRLAAEILGAA